MSERHAFRWFMGINIAILVWAFIFLYAPRMR